MSTGQVSAGYALGQKAIKPARKIRKQKVKLSLRHRLRNWLMRDEEEEAPQGLYVEADRLSSEGIRLQIYKAQGGYVVETRGYDRKTDRNNTSMHVITEDSDLGDSLGKIVMMEALRG